MVMSNHERIGKALELLNRGLRPFVERELRAVYGEGWMEAAGQGLRDDRPRTRRTNDVTSWDTQALLTILWDQWNTVFRNTLGQAERTLVSELREVRNKWAHQESFNTDDAYRALDSLVRLLKAVSAVEADEVDKQKQELLRVCFDEQARRETRRRGPGGRPAGGRAETVARDRDAAPRCRLRPLPASRIRRRPRPGISPRRERRVPGSHRVLPPHLPHRGTQAPPQRRLATSERPWRRAGGGAADQLRGR